MMHRVHLAMMVCDSHSRERSVGQIWLATSNYIPLICMFLLKAIVKVERRHELNPPLINRLHSHDFIKFNCYYTHNGHTKN
jgi:hypothetical protein